MMDVCVILICEKKKKKVVGKLNWVNDARQVFEYVCWCWCERERENEWEREISKVEVVFDEWSCYCEGMNEWWWLVDADDDEIDKLD